MSLVCTYNADDQQETTVPQMPQMTQTTWISRAILVLVLMATAGLAAQQNRIDMLKLALRVCWK